MNRLIFRKKGISLVALIITIIVLVILTGTVIIILTQGDIIGKSKEAVFKNNMAVYQEELRNRILMAQLNHKISNKDEVQVEETSFDAILDESFDLADGYGGIKDWIPSADDKYRGKLVITGGELQYVGTDAEEQEWATEIGMYNVGNLENEGSVVNPYDSTVIPERTWNIGKINETDVVAKLYLKENGNFALVIEGTGEMMDFEGYDECGNAISEGPMTEFGDYDLDGDYKIEEVYITNGVTNIGNGAFAYSFFMNSVSIAHTVTRIGISAFRECNNLREVTIPNGVVDIGSYAFAYCYNLANITIPSGMTSISDFTFYCCSGLESIIIPDSITSIGSYAFTDCYDLVNITIPTSVISIGAHAFESCDNITSIIIPSSVTSMEDHVFRVCQNLRRICCEAVSKPTSWNTDWNRECNAEVRWGYDGYVEILDIGRVTPKNITAKIYLNDNNKYNFKIEGIGDTKNYSNFSPESNEMTQHVNCGFMYINDQYYDMNEDELDYNTYNIENVEIINGVTSIGNSLFEYCDNLTSISIPNSVTKIGSLAFSCCSSLTSITIPTSVTNIGAYAFDSCANLTSIIIPSSVTSIECGAFRTCGNLTNIYCRASSKPAGWDEEWNCSGATVTWGYTGN